MKIVKHRGSLIIHKQALKYTQGLHTALLSGGTKNEDTKGGDESQRIQAASGLVHARRPRGGVSLFVKSKSKGGHHLVL